MEMHYFLQRNYLVTNPNLRDKLRHMARNITYIILNALIFYIDIFSLHQSKCFAVLY